MILIVWVAAAPSRRPAAAITQGATAPSGAARGLAYCVGSSSVVDGEAGAYSPGMWASAWSRLMASQQLLLLSATTAMVRD